MLHLREPPSVLRGGRYVLGDVLGEGGMAVVCKATDTELGVERAIKVVFHLAGHPSLESMRRRLKQEARAMARLHHPNILGIHDVGHDDNYDWVVMDLAEGGSLRDVQQRGPLAPVDATRLMIQVLSALATAHAASIVHRDVKPHNILLDARGRPLLADFGIALLMGDDRRTRTGVAMGSLAYMPPEQRLDAARVGPAADIYAAGTTLYDLITGDNPVDLFLAKEGDPRWDAVPEVLRPILVRACAPLPDGRFPDAGSMAHALLEVLQRTNPEELESLVRPRIEYPAPSEAFTDKSLRPTADEDVRAAMTFLDEHVVIGPAGPTLTAAVGHEAAASGPPRTPTVRDDDPTMAPPDLQAAAAPARPRQAVLVAAALVLVGVLLVSLWAAGPDGGGQASDEVVARELLPREPDLDADDEPEPADGGETEAVAVAAPAPVARPVPTRPAIAPGPKDLEPVIGGAAGGEPPLGRWRGGLGNLELELVLEGSPDALRGRAIKHASDGPVSDAPVRGHVDDSAGVPQVVLVAAFPTDHHLELSLVQDGFGTWRLEGPVAMGSRQVTVSLKAQP